MTYIHHIPPASLCAGYFEERKQAGEWTTYDKHGRVYQVTKMKP